MTTKVYSIINHKGGVGKSTIATNIAGYYANKKQKVLLGDFDVQRSSLNWLRIRPDGVAKISYWEIQDGQLTQPPEDTDVIIIDAPAGCRGNDLKNLLSLTDKVIVPLQPGIFDILSTRSFLQELADIIADEDLEDQVEICIIGNGIIPKTEPTNALLKYIKSTGLTNPINISVDQIYKHLTANGLTLFDAKSTAFQKEKRNWKNLITWLDENVENAEDDFESEDQKVANN